MALLFETIYTDGLAQISYVVGDTEAGIAAVIDPRRDVDVYFEIARAKGVRLAYAIETHIHADFASGVHELSKHLPIGLIGGRSGDYQFVLRQLGDGEVIELGSVRLNALHTPGHTPEHISLLLYDAQQGDQPFGVFTGDTLFNLDVGRPDLVGKDKEPELARQLHRSIFGKLVPLGDRIEVYPCHSAGSACGKSIGDHRRSTIGNERVFSPALREAHQHSESQFVEWLLKDIPEPPRHYARLKKLNARGAPVLGGVPLPPPLSPAEFRQQAKDCQVLDVRSILAFGGGHVPGALNIALQNEFVNWAGWMLEADEPILLVADNAAAVHQAVTHLYRIGLDRIAGYLRNGMTDWQNAGLPLERVAEWTVHELEERRKRPDTLVLDVRSDNEVKQGRVPGAQHVFVAHLEEHVDELDRERTIATYCGSGYRASIAASLLKKHGFRKVVNIPGSWTAWKQAGLPIENM